MPPKKPPPQKSSHSKAPKVRAAVTAKRKAPDDTPSKKQKPSPAPDAAPPPRPNGVAADVAQLSFPVLDSLGRFASENRNKVMASRRCARVRTLIGSASADAGVSSFCVMVLPSVKQTPSAPRRSRVHVLRSGAFATDTSVPPPTTQAQMVQHLLHGIDMPGVFAALGVESPQRGWDGTIEEATRVSTDLRDAVIVQRTSREMTEEQASALRHRRKVSGAETICLLEQTIAMQRDTHRSEMRQKDDRIDSLTKERDLLKQQLKEVTAQLTELRNKEFFARGSGNNSSDTTPIAAAAAAATQVAPPTSTRITMTKEDFIRAGADSITLHAFTLLGTLRTLFGGRIIPSRISFMRQKGVTEEQLGAYNVEWNRMLRDMFEWCDRLTPAVPFALFNITLPLFVRILSQMIHVATGLSAKVRTARLRHRVDMPKLVQQMIDYFSWLHASSNWRRGEDKYPLLMGTIDWPRFQTALNECYQYVYIVDEQTVTQLNSRKKQLWAVNKRKHYARKKARSTSSPPSSSSSSSSSSFASHSASSREEPRVSSGTTRAHAIRHDGSVDGASSSVDEDDDDVTDDNALDLGESTPKGATLSPSTLSTPVPKGRSTPRRPFTRSIPTPMTRKLNWTDPTLEESTEISVSSEHTTESSSSPPPARSLRRRTPRTRTHTTPALPSPPPVLMRVRKKRN